MWQDIEKIIQIGQNIVSLIPLGAIVLYIIKCFQVDAVDLVFMSKERNAYTTFVQCAFLGVAYGCYMDILTRIAQDVYCNEVLFITTLVICLVLFVLSSVFFAIIIFYPYKIKKLLHSCKIKLTNKKINFYFIVSFIMFILLTGYDLINLAGVGADREQLSFFIIAFSIIVLLYMFYVIKVSNSLSNVRVWISYKSYEKIYLLYKLDKKTILCEIPCTDDSEEKQYIRIPLERIMDRPLHREQKCNDRCNEEYISSEVREES